MKQAQAVKSIFLAHSKAASTKYYAIISRNLKQKNLPSRIEFALRFPSDL